MKIVHLPQNSDEWFDARKGKITGSKLKDVLTKRGDSTKLGVFQLIADKLAVDRPEEDDRDRGHRLEEKCAEAMAKKHKLKLEQDGMWVSEDNENIAISPDRVVIDKDDVRRVAAEIKCLSSAKHIQYYIEEKVPLEFEDQILQYFIVNPDLDKLILGFYDDSIPNLEYHDKIILREDVQDKVDSVLEIELAMLDFVDEWVERLAF